MTTTQTQAATLAGEGISAGYGGVAVIHNVDIRVSPGEIVALLGPNGAGKTTTLLTLAGEIAPLSGSVTMQGEVCRTPLYRRARKGLRLITEERSVFMSLSVADNLRLAHRDFEPCLELFPELRPLLKRKAGLLSGGEQQMLTLSRAIVGECRVLLADELSLGLSPMATNRLLEALRLAADRGVATILVEQQLDRALRVADRAYVMRRGNVVLEGTAEYIAEHHEEVESSYLSAERSE